MSIRSIGNLKPIRSSRHPCVKNSLCRVTKTLHSCHTFHFIVSQVVLPTLLRSHEIVSTAVTLTPNLNSNAKFNGRLQPMS